MREFLAEYAAGTLPPADRGAVARHLPDCADCRTELASWQAMTELAIEPPGPDIVRRALLTGVLEPVPSVGAGGAVRHRWRLWVGLLRTQTRLMPTSLWVVSALAVVGAVTAAYTTAAPVAGSVLSVVLPGVVALGIAAMCAPDGDPAGELCTATMTGYRLIVLARLTVVLGHSLILAMTGSGALWLLSARADPLTGLIAGWLGPMVLLSSLALLTAVLVGAEVATATAAAVWLARLAAGGWFGTAAGWLAPIRVVWVTNPGTVLVGLALIGVATIFAGRFEPRRRHHATSLI